MQNKNAVYAVMNKPAGYITTASDELNRETVYDLLPLEFKRQWIFPVGRLDKDSEGLLLFTSDSAFSTRITDPASHIEKIYRVQLDHLPARQKIDEICRGVELKGDGKTLPCRIERERGRWFLVYLREGRNRQIRRMFWHIRCRVKKLIRIRIGALECPDLKPGETRVLAPEEIRLLLKKG
jgi:23S rRNA pseudouridine2605 synthase